MVRNGSAPSPGARSQALSQAERGRTPRWRLDGWGQTGKKASNRGSERSGGEMGQQEQMGVMGLGVMGRSLAINLVDHGIDTRVRNLELEAIPELLAAHPAPNLSGTADLSEFVKGLKRPRRLLMMITAGAPVDAMLERLLPLLDTGDVVVDGGNSWYEDTLRRQQQCDALGIRYVGMGVSGGEEGARHGPSMMPGGDPEAVAALMPMLERIAAQTHTGPCVTHVGKGGAGHFVKMVHNGIEYADMQLLAEAYDLLRRGDGADASTIAELFAGWNEGPLNAFLLELSAGVLRRIDERTGRPLVEVVLDAAGQKGTGRWTAGEALRLGVATPSITAAVDARVLSSMKASRVEASTRLTGPQPPFPDRSAGLSRRQQIHDALYAARIVTWAQGIDLMRTASRAHAWDIDLAEVL